MNIAGTQFTLEAKAFEIYISGCNNNPKCIGCNNQQLWSFTNGDPYTELYLQNIKNKVSNSGGLIEKIVILGGEPNDQPHKELLKLLIDMKKLDKKLWLFTRYELNEVPWFVKIYCDYIKCGKYAEELKTDTNIQYGIKLSTTNQKIYKKGKDY